MAKARTTKKNTDDTTAVTKSAAPRTKCDFTSLYESLIDLTARPDVFHPSGSIILDAILSNGKGFPKVPLLKLHQNQGVVNLQCVCILQRSTVHKENV